MSSHGSTWKHIVAAIVGAPLLFIGGASILLGRAGTPTVVLLVLAAPLVYAGLGLPMPKFEAPGVVLSFESPVDKDTPAKIKSSAGTSPSGSSSIAAGAERSRGPRRAARSG